jgi:hypothetical protein
MTACTAMKRASRDLSALAAASLGMGLAIFALAAPAKASETFGIDQLENSLTISQKGPPATQAGSHPYAMTTTFLLDRHQVKKEEELQFFPDGGDLKNIEVNLPVGVIINPNATPVRCTEAELEHGPPDCPNASAMGVVTVNTSSFPEAQAPVFDMVPPPRVPGEFGFNLAGLGFVAHIVGRVRTGGDYGLSADVSNITQKLGVYGATLILWGSPSDEGHDKLRGECAYGGNEAEKEARKAKEEKEVEEGERAKIEGVYICAVERTGRPLLTLPSSCSGSMKATMRAASWLEPENWTPFKESSPAMPAITGCGELDFSPSLSVKPEPEGVAADSPSGLNVDLHIPQEESVRALAEANLKDAVVTLPVGIAVSPSAANSLAACSPEEIGLHNAEVPSCPDSAKVGESELTTPLLEQPLKGSVYLAQQSNNPFGSLLALYLVAEGNGALIKLAGEVKLDPLTGQLTTTFDNNPQLPFSDLKLKFFGGPRAPLITPPGCGTYETQSSLTPWSGTPAVTPSDTFSISSGCGGGFAPTFSAETTTPAAGGYSPLSVTVSRRDGEQRLADVALQLPPGLLAKVAGIPQCPEPQASTGTCPAASQVGTVTAAAGPGPDPFIVPESGQPANPVYLTGPYDGAPFGLSIVTHALAGPFDLGNVIVRATIRIDPRTAQVTVVSDRLPSILQGIPLDVRTVQVTVDRSGFVFNPTNCAAQAINGTITSVQGPSTSASSPFAVGGCSGLPFRPSFKASTQAKTSKANGANLVVKVAQRPGEANIHKVDLQLPLALPSRLTTLQKACTEAQFDANPAGCPAASVIGTAKAVTPVLTVPLTGPAYVVSHGGAAFPDVEFILQGEGVTIVLDGKTDIKKGITYSHFETVPDAPISSFETNLPEGPHSALSAFGNLCAQNLVMATTIVGQNGAQVKQSTKIAVSGCRAVTISKRKLSGKSVVLTFILRSKGTVTITGKGLKSYRKTLGAGSHQVKVALSKAGLSARKHHRKTKITVALKSASKTLSSTTTLKL